MKKLLLLLTLVLPIVPLKSEAQTIAPYFSTPSCTAFAGYDFQGNPVYIRTDCGVRVYSVDNGYPGPRYWNRPPRVVVPVVPNSYCERTSLSVLGIPILGTQISVNGC